MNISKLSSAAPTSSAARAHSPSKRSRERSARCLPEVAAVVEVDLDHEHADPPGGGWRAH